MIKLIKASNQTYEDDVYCDCSLHRSVVSILNSHSECDVLLPLPDAVMHVIASFSGDLFGYARQFETKYNRVRQEFKRIMFSHTIGLGEEHLLYDAYDKGDPDCLSVFMEPRLIEYDTAIHSYDDFADHILQGYAVDCEFRDLFKNYSKTLFELICIYYTSIQHYFDVYVFGFMNISVGKIPFEKDDSPAGLYWSTEPESDDESSDEEWNAGIVDHRHEWFKAYHIKCVSNGSLKKYYGYME